MKNLNKHWKEWISPSIILGCTLSWIYIWVGEKRLPSGSAFFREAFYKAVQNTEFEKEFEFYQRECINSREFDTAKQNLLYNIGILYIGRKSYYILQKTLRRYEEHDIYPKCENIARIFLTELEKAKEED